MPEPKQKPGKSKQDYATPWSLISAVQVRWGKLDIDLAATAENAKADRFITPETDSLKVPWGAYADAHKLRLAWLNPPFADIAPWAEKALNSATPSGLRIIMLTPASVGANWFRDYVHGRADVVALNGRITFEGAPDPYPKDCMLTLFGFEPGFDVWTWTK